MSPKIPEVRCLSESCIGQSWRAAAHPFLAESAQHADRAKELFKISRASQSHSICFKLYKYAGIPKYVW
jgi:hypothetical protein